MYLNDVLWLLFFLCTKTPWRYRIFAQQYGRIDVWTMFPLENTGNCFIKTYLNKFLVNTVQITQIRKGIPCRYIVVKRCSLNVLISKDSACHLSISLSNPGRLEIFNRLCKEWREFILGMWKGGRQY